MQYILQYGSAVLQYGSAVLQYIAICFLSYCFTSTHYGKKLPCMILNFVMLLEPNTSTRKINNISCIHSLHITVYVSGFSINPLPDMPILGFSNSAKNKDMMSKIWMNGDTIQIPQFSLS